MKSVIDQHDGVVIIQLNGKLDIGVGDIHLDARIDEVREMGYTKIILDMEQVTYADSSGIGDLIMQHTVLAKEGCLLCLANLQPKLMSLMLLTQLITVLPIYDSVEDAMVYLYTHEEEQPAVAA